MKRFEFRLQRVLDLRRQQSEVERAKLQVALAAITKLENERRSIVQQVEDARVHVKHRPSTSGEDLAALSHFESHCRRKTIEVAKQQDKATLQMQEQQALVRDVDRKVKLLENLQRRRLADWTVQRDKEIEDLAADSHLARMISNRKAASLQ